MSPIRNNIDLKFNNIEDLSRILHTEGCRVCDLGFQPSLNGCCVARGNPYKYRMVIGEGPGKYEDAKSSPFVGPAGKLLDKIFASVEWDTNEDWYLTNIILCRFIAEAGSGKENLTPKIEQRKKCRPYLDQQINLIKPKIIVTLGIPATEEILGIKSIKMGEYRGRIIYQYNRIVFPMLHPASILHASGNAEKYNLYREQTWEDIRNLKQLVERENL